MNKLQSLINSKYEKLGDTEAGAAWALMALHPSAGPLSLRGIPDGNFPSVCMDYEVVKSIVPPSGNVGAWSCVLNVLPHPVQPACFVSSDANGHIDYGGIINPTLTQAATYSDYTTQMAQLCTAYRIIYAGVTIDLDASGLDDSGSIVAGQFPIVSQTFNYSSDDAYAHIECTNYVANFPGQRIAQLPGAFMGLAKDGIYMPIKIDPKAPWVTTATCSVVTLSNPTAATDPTLTTLRGFSLPPAIPLAGITFPYYGSAYYGTPHALVGAYTAAGALNGDIVVPAQQRNMGHIVFYNLKPNANLTVKMRWGVEMRVDPTSVLAPSIKPSAFIDPTAILAYSDIASSLPWAYPSDYNANNKIVDIIKQAWNTFKPILAAGLSAVPHPAAQLVGQAVSALPSFERPAGTGTIITKTPTPVMRPVSVAPRRRKIKVRVKS